MPAPGMAGLRLIRQLVDDINNEPVLVYPDTPPQATTSWRRRGDSKPGEVVSRGER